MVVTYPSEKPSRLWLSQGLAAVVLIAAVAWCYAPAWHGEFLLDDFPQIVENSSLRSLSFPWGFLAGVRRPVLYATLALNVHMAGLNPASFHGLNILIHMASALALWIFLRAFFTATGVIPSRSTADKLAWMAALLWAVHPIQTQAVAYVIQRAESLMALLFILSLVAALKFFQTQKRVWGLVTTLLSLLAVLTKESGLSVWGVIVVMDLFFFSRDGRNLWRRHKKFYAGGALTTAVFGCLLLTVHPVEVEPSYGYGLSEVSPWGYLLTQPSVILHYVKEMVWPVTGAFDYAWPWVSSMTEYVWSVGMLSLAGVGAVWAVRRRTVWGFFYLSTLLILAPSSGAVPLNDAAFSYRMYLPSAVIIASCVLGLWHGLRYLPTGRGLTAGLLTVFCTVPLAVMTRHKAGLYSDPLHLWEETVRKRPDNARAHNNLGVYLYQHGQQQLGLAHIERALELNPEVRGLNNVAVFYLEEGHVREARRKLLQALEVDPSFPDTYLNLYALARHQGQIEEAQRWARKALTVDPENGLGWHNQGVLAFQRGDFTQAITYFLRAIHHGFQEEGVYRDLIAALWAEGQTARAGRIVKEVLKRHPEWEDVKKQYMSLVQQSLGIKVKKGSLGRNEGF